MVMSIDPGAPPLSAVLDAAVSTIAQVVADLEVGCISGRDAALLAALFAKGERLCAAGKALTAVKVADAGTWIGSGARSPEEWLANISGTGLGTARAALETAESLHQ